MSVRKELAQLKAEVADLKTHNHKPIFDRLSALECPSPLMLDLVQRVCRLDGGSDCEVHHCGECKFNYGMGCWRYWSGKRWHEIKGLEPPCELFELKSESG